MLSRPVSYRITARNNRILTDVMPTNNPSAQNHQLTWFLYSVTNEMDYTLHF